MCYALNHITNREQKGYKQAIKRKRADQRKTSLVSEERVCKCWIMEAPAFQGYLITGNPKDGYTILQEPLNDIRRRRLLPCFLPCNPKYTGIILKIRTLSNIPCS